jgi:peptide/nickel transport system substrate-binding protein
MSQRQRSLVQWFSLFCAALLLLVSCGRSTPELGNSSSSLTGDRITIGTTATISTIDPADAYSIFSGLLLYNLGDRLYTYKSGTNELEPQLAIALPKVSADGLTYTIPLRQGVMFHDGERFDAKAMAFSLKRFAENGGSPAFLLSDLIKSAEPTAEYELTIQLKKPFAAFPSLLGFSGICAVSPKAYEIKKGAFKSEGFVGTGPYKLAKYGTDTLRLVAFDRYWGTKPKNQGIDIQFFSSPANLFNAFRSKSIDVAFQSLALDQIRSLRRQSKTGAWQMVEQSGSGIEYLTLNLKSAPLDQLEVRQALAAAFDRPLLQERVFQGQIEPLYSLIPNTLPAHQAVFQQQYGDRNVAKAIKLLTKAGFSETKPLKLEFWYRSNLANDQLAAVTLKAIVQKNLGKVMQLEVKGIDSTTAYKNLDKGAYPMFLLDWNPDFNDPDNYIQPFLECSKGSKDKGCEDGSSFLQGSFYYSDRANQLIDQSRKELNPVTRKQLFAELQTLLAQEVPFVPLWQGKDYLFVQNQIQGARLEVTRKIPFSALHKAS